MKKQILLLIGVSLSMLLSGCKSNEIVETSVAETIDKYAVNAEINVNNSVDNTIVNDENVENSNNESGDINNGTPDKKNEENTMSAWEKESLANKALDESIAAEESSIAAKEYSEPFEIYAVYERTEGTNIIVSLYNNDSTIEYTIDSTLITGGVDELNSKDEILIECTGKFDDEAKIIHDVSKITNYTKQLEEQSELDRQKNLEEEGHFDSNEEATEINE